MPVAEDSSIRVGDSGHTRVGGSGEYGVTMTSWQGHTYDGDDRTSVNFCRTCQGPPPEINQNTPKSTRAPRNQR
eukprot:3589385-Rhodomonas_salina.2